MRFLGSGAYIAANQAWLVAGFRRLLDEARERLGAAAPSGSDGGPDAGAPQPGGSATLEGLGAPSTLDQLAHRFALTGFERDLLLLLTGFEVDAAFARAMRGCLETHVPDAQAGVTFGSALAVLREPHWSALGPESPLRFWRLVEVVPGPSLTHSRLRLEESVLHAICGAPHLDERLLELVSPLPGAEPRTASQSQAAKALAAALGRPPQAGLPSAVLVLGPNDEDKRGVVGAAAAMAGLQRAMMLPLDLIPAPAGELDGLARLWAREAALHDLLLLVDCGEEAPDGPRQAILRRFAERNRAHIAIGITDKIRLPGVSAVTVAMPAPDAGEQKDLWTRTMGPFAAGINGGLDRLVRQFPLSASAIAAMGGDIRSELGTPGEAGAAGDGPRAPGERAFELAWQACRGRGRQRIGDLARLIVPGVSWEDLVLPDMARQILRQIAAEVRQRHKVYGEWGFGGRSSRGMGVSVLFAGPSGTGKTLAAEVLAADLRLDLYQIDLSSVVSKYIGETEKNLKRLFDAAEESGAILLFDEADALFGKRSEVKDSHDRFANIEVGYLLQRMEAYRGLAILTSNLKQNLDAAFLRRLRHIVHFPFPDERQRLEIWRRAFPGGAPCREVAPEKLAKLSVSGGHIRNIALTASFLAADESAEVGMPHLLRAARAEFAKLEKPLNEAEVGGWI